MPLQPRSIGFRSSFLSLFLALSSSAALTGQQVPPKRPNVLWLSSEDNGPHLGAYGDTFADTPNLDRLAARGLRYDVVWSNAPVCAPARTAIISGLYPTSTGSQHMRSLTRLPTGFRFFPEYLREAGYYTTNNAKEDYNLEKPGQVWDESSRHAHWRNRPPGAPFFAVFNFLDTHESQIRRRPHRPVHDPQKVPLPAYHPDTPEVRRDWAQYYDKMTEMDARAGERLRELEEAGLSDSTVVFYWGDHGPGLPRLKRTPLDSGLRVPLVVYIPPRFRHLAPEGYEEGGVTARPVSFVDFAPTVLSLAGIEPPGHLQGHAFLGPFEAPPREHVFGFRGRMDERIDMSRSVRDRRYLYVRNFMPHRSWGEHVAYLFETDTTRVWKRLYDEGLLRPEQRQFFAPTKPSEELYDLATDPDQVRNLADSEEHATALERLRRVLERHLIATRDLGFLPESQLVARSRSRTPWDVGHDAAYDVTSLLQIADLASRRGAGDLPRLQEALASNEPAIRYWGALGHLVRGAEAVRSAEPALRRLLEDPDPAVRVVAAEALGLHGERESVSAALETLIELADLRRHDVYVALEALNGLDALDHRAAAVAGRIAALPQSSDAVLPQMRSHVPRLLEKILADLEAESEAAGSASARLGL